MYCENLIMEAQIADKKKQMELLAEFYVCNRALLIEMRKDYHINANDIDDFDQLCYLAMVDVCRAFRVGQVPLVAYVRRCIKHQYFLYWLSTNYPVRLNHHNYKDALESGVGYGDPEELNSFYDLDTRYNIVELEISKKVLWDSIHRYLSELEFFVLFSFYKNNLSIKEIASRCRMTVPQITDRKRRALIRLRKCREVQQIAFDFYGIKWRSNEKSK